MPQAVVDLFEAVQIDATHGNPRALTPGGDERLTQPILQQEPIGQPGQMIVMVTMVKLVIKPVMFDCHAAEITEAANGFARGVVQQGLAGIEYGDHAVRFSGTRAQGRSQAELNACFQNFPEGGAGTVGAIARF
jgi:hypothetical protein